MPFVIDASITLAWGFRDEQTPYSLGILARLEQDDAVVPALWALEVANGLLVAERRGRVAAGEAAELASAVHDLNVTLVDFTLDDALGRLLDLSRAHGLTVYDAAYLELAMREGLALATEDDDLRSAAHSAGIPIVP